MSRSGTMRLAAALAAAGLALSACGLSGGTKSTKDVEAGSIDPNALKGASFTVGSKDFSEQRILGYITILALQAAGADVTDKTNIQGSANTRKALESGDIDMYWEYTGTAWITYLGETKPVPDADQQYAAVKKADAQKNGLTWLQTAPFNNTYAIALSKENASKLGVETISDYAELVNSDPAKATTCIESEFASRDDGYPGLEKAYGFDLPAKYTRNVDTGVVYTQIDKGDTCVFGEAFDTDGRLQALDLVTLTDDKSFFPIYEPAVTLKESTLQENPKLKNFFAPIAAKLDTDTMRQLNARMDVKGEDPEDIAEDWLKQEGFIK